MKRILTAAVAIIVALSLISCGAGYPVMDEFEADGFEFCLHGDGTVRAIEILDADGGRIGLISVSGEMTFNDECEHYGFTACDLNFDGCTDMMLITGKDAGVLSYRAWLYDADKNKFKASDELSALKNLTVYPDEGRVSGYEFEQRLASTKGVKPEVYNEIYKNSYYKWENGSLVLDYYITLTFYGSEQLWAYTVWEPDGEGGFTEQSEKWIFDGNLGDYDIRPR